ARACSRHASGRLAAMDPVFRSEGRGSPTCGTLPWNRRSYDRWIPFVGEVRMDRRTFMGRVAAGSVALPLACWAQQAARMPRIGVLYRGKVATGGEALRQGLQELGYVEGRTVVIEWRWWEGSPERLRDAVAEMTRLNPDVVVVGGSEA